MIVNIHGIATDKVTVPSVEDIIIYISDICKAPPIFNDLGQSDWTNAFRQRTVWPQRGLPNWENEIVVKKLAWGAIAITALSSNAFAVAITPIDQYPVGGDLAPITIKKGQQLTVTIVKADDQIDILSNGKEAGQYALLGQAVGTTNLTPTLSTGTNQVAIVTTDFGPQGDNHWTCAFYFQVGGQGGEVDPIGWDYRRIGQHDQHASVTYNVKINVEP